MSSDLMQVLLSAGGGFLAIVALLVLCAVIVYRLSPGRAPIGLRSDAVDGVVRVVRVRRDTRRFRTVGDVADSRLNSVCIDVDTPHGVQRYEDQPVRPKNLPGPIRGQVYSWKKWLEDNSFNIDDDEARMRAGQAIDNGGYEFELAKPLPVKVVPPRKANTRIKWKLV